MAENLRDFVERHTLGKHDGRSGVAELMWIPVTETGCLGEGRELLPEVRRVDWRADWCGEDEVVVAPERGGETLGRLLPSVLLKCPADRDRKCLDSPRIFRFRGAEYEPRRGLGPCAIGERCVAQPLQ